MEVTDIFWKCCSWWKLDVRVSSWASGKNYFTNNCPDTALHCRYRYYYTDTQEVLHHAARYHCVHSCSSSAPNDNRAIATGSREFLPQLIPGHGADHILLGRLLHGLLFSTAIHDGALLVAQLMLQISCQNVPDKDLPIFSAGNHKPVPSSQCRSDSVVIVDELFVLQCLQQLAITLVYESDRRV